MEPTDQLKLMWGPVRFAWWSVWVTVGLTVMKKGKFTGIRWNACRGCLWISKQWLRYRALHGRSVRVPVGAFANGSAIQYYALKAHQPEAVAGPAGMPAQAGAQRGAAPSSAAA